MATSIGIYPGGPRTGTLAGGSPLGQAVGRALGDLDHARPSSRRTVSRRRRALRTLYATALVYGLAILLGLWLGSRRPGHSPVPEARAPTMSNRIDAAQDRLIAELWKMELSGRGSSGP